MVIKSEKSSSTRFGEHPNFGLNAEVAFPWLETVNYVSYFVYFSYLKTIYGYFITIILISILDLRMSLVLSDIDVNEIA